MDIAVNLVESYLRLNGYLTLSEFEVQAPAPGGGFLTITDIDIMAMRLPGDQHTADSGEDPHSRLMLIDDPVLELDGDLIDVIVGEVKQGEAEFNPGIRRRDVLHSMLHRVEWLYEEPLRTVIDALAHHSVRVGPARGGGRIRTRLVAFGRSRVNDLHTISHTHMVETLIGFFEQLDEAFRPVQFRDPAPAMLALLHKTGFEVAKDGRLHHGGAAERASMPPPT